tara:strand:- start:999 stop:1757 length:759 start_codon:yes stop_codon:yes gene_type:complete
MNVFEKCLRYIFKVNAILGIIAYLRFLYFFYIKKNFKTLYPVDSSDFGMAKNSYETALESNVYHLNKPISNFFKYFGKFRGSRTDLLCYPLKSLGIIDYQNSKVLAVGPRLESEIFTLFTNGFRFKNIKSIDLQSYSKLVDLGDMLKMPYEDNSFDVVFAGWVIAYTDKVEDSIKEFIRVAKNGSLICIGISHKPDIQLSKVPLKSSKEILSYFGNNLNDVYFSFHPNDPNFIKKENQLNSYRSIIVVSIKK